ncbi:MAG TPA: S8 family serine peptidase [Acidimicrobiales bacterium]|nr:S8 family serine peptidase [Acidimicrobiales bacterium]
MTRTMVTEDGRRHRVLALALAVTVVLLAHVGPTGASVPGAAASTPAMASPVRVIVQATAAGVSSVARAVERIGGTVDRPLPLVDGFAATVPADGVATLEATPGVRAVTADRRVQFEELTYDDSTTASSFAKVSGATSSWTSGNLGAGIGVAVIDTGISSMNDFTGRLVFGPDLSGEGTTTDTYGHGTVMAGIIGGSGADSANRSGGAFTGVAPKATLVSVKVAGRNGVTDVSTVLQAMHWVSAYKDQFNIRVLNLSWGVPSTQDPSVDPLNYAVERLWQQGITVVVAGGNSGPTAGTITKPADDPMVLTVGAYNDGQNTDPADDAVPGWSSRGPTAQGLAKPDVVAPGRSLVATRSFGSAVEAENPKSLQPPSYIKGSGSSESAAVASGLSALLVAQRPAYSPDQVKTAFKRSASPIANTAASLQGAGRLDLARALTADAGAVVQQTSRATGLGSIEASRGGRNVTTDCFMDGTLDLIKGEITDKCVPWDGNSWTGNSWTGNSWTGNSWTGNSWTGNSWTGNSWTNATWTGNSWTGGTWTGNSWTGNSWTGNSWTGNSWTGNSWTGNSWTNTAWTTAEYETIDETGFLSAFWGPHPGWTQHFPGESSEPRPREARSVR